MSTTSTHSSVKYHQVSDDEAGQRIDNFLLRLLKGLPRSRVYRLLRRGEVRVDGGRAKPTRRLQAGEVVRLPPVVIADSEHKPRPEPSSGLERALRDGVLYEDERLLVIDKPSGLAVHGGSTVKIGLIEALRQIRSDLHFVELVHRLDQETSGCLLLAKRRSTLRRLHEMLRNGDIEKRYTALLVGEVKQPEQVIDAPIEKLAGAGHERLVRVSQRGRSAQTLVKVISQSPYGTLVDIKLTTGRTHQIRVHARHIGHPVAGDDRYGERQSNSRLRTELGLRRLFLHANELAFRHPEQGNRLHVQAPLSAELNKVLTNAMK
ncbi:ribosomal large subunit pseudouridine synthase C [Halorhodospira halochloris]|uniref:Pseudouridine synthase n=1 Tax=Halorhodospira halochloris TaxID=1052 RepID=A0A110B212_HALHR|nr:RluA family pseudouridine synthase [Halorhodospira halochloris]MBK1652093.1 23S rRNA pseudouridine(955/2504/2580) synthase [Halorhodospira halochloris]MCG5549041.1 RluA family pseudouridine synthase [Halorhodospira halochloris]BAU58015.1 ribosomal large subunit pseudouridine synthase C [Halorhodospira halochloris]